MCETPMVGGSCIAAALFLSLSSPTTSSSNKGPQQTSGMAREEGRWFVPFHFHLLLAFPDCMKFYFLQLSHAIGLAKSATASLGKFTPSLVSW